MGGEVNVRVRRRVSELATAISTYRAFLEGVDISTAKRVEEVQATIIEDAAGSINVESSLRDNVALLMEKGALERYISMAARLTGEEVADYSRALRAALSGDMSVPGARAALLALQAVARAYAERYSRVKGEVSDYTPYCPLCGALSQTMAKGRRGYYMVCHFCGYKWAIPGEAPSCPYCGNSNPVSIGVYSDKSRRVGLAWCQECGSTWMIILDERIRAPSILLPLIASWASRYLHLARGRGEG